MNTIITLITAVSLFLTTLAFAAPPKTISYQGYLKDGTGKPVTTATNVVFSLSSSNPARNNPVWRESRSVTPVNGVYSVQLGSVTSITATFDVPYFLGLKVGSDAEMVLQPLGSAPYALRASVAESAGSVGGQTLPQLDTRYIDPTRPAPTAQQLATLRWDQVAGGASGTYPAGSSPKALAVAVDGLAVLDKLAAMPVYHWQPKDGPNAELKHVGPMAQDFYATFGLGDSDTAIGMQDEEGVALAAIQGLNLKLEQVAREKNEQLRAQAEKIAELEKDRTQQAARIEALEKQAGQMAILLGRLENMQRVTMVTNR